MVLHLRKIIAVISALIVMMGAMPAFAAEKEMPVTTEEIQVKETAEEVKEPPAAEKTGDTCETQTPEKQAQPEGENNGCNDENSEEDEDAAVQEQMAIVYLTFSDEEGVKLIDEESFEVAEGTSLKEFLETVMENMEKECQWDLYHIECNDEEVDGEEPEKLILNSDDRLIISFDAEETEMADQTDKTEKAEETGDAIRFEAQATESEISSSSHKAGRKTEEIMNSSDWAWGGEWGIIGLSRLSDVSSNYAEKYCRSLATYLKENESDCLSQTKSSDNARTVLALTALGFDPTNVNGYDLLAPLADFEYVEKLYLSGPVWTLIAIDSHSYTLPKAEKGKTQTTRELLVETILKEQKGAGWSFSGGAPEVDMTCMVIQALAPYYGKEDTRVDGAVDKAVNWLSNMQNKNGGYTSFGNESSESASQVITALTAIGIDPDKDPRFIKNGKSVVDFLLSFRTKDGGFKHLAADSKYNTLSTYQGCYALTAYIRFAEGRSSLYDMNDVTLEKFTARPNSPADNDPDNDQDDPQRTDTKGKDDESTNGKELQGASMTLGKTFSLGGRSISLGAVTAESDTEAEAAVKSGLSSEGYDTIAEKNRLMNTLPWIYGGIAALAALALIVVIRNRKPE